jgi:uncharacterized protein (DUF2461 family)
VIRQRGFYQEYFSLSEMGTKGAGGGFYRRVVCDDGVLGVGWWRRSGATLRRARGKEGA